jgi:hypothetical protein
MESPISAARGAASKTAARESYLAEDRRDADQAHGSGKRDDLEHATGQLRRALDAEGWAA